MAPSCTRHRDLLDLNMDSNIAPAGASLPQGNMQQQHASLSTTCTYYLCLCLVHDAQMYNSTGLIGLLATTTDGSAVAAADALTAKLQGVAKAAGDAQLAAAKQVALGGYQSAISAKSGVVQDMGLQLLSRGKFSAQVGCCCCCCALEVGASSALGH